MNSSEEASKLNQKIILVFLAFISLYLMFGFGWLFWVLGLISLPFPQVAIGLLVVLWKMKFLYWLIPGFFKWMITEVSPTQSWD